MVIWSSLKNAVLRSSVFKSSLGLQTRSMGEHRKMIITPSRWQWQKTKDYLHFYFMVGAIPVGLLVFYCNVFIGPAQLAEIPEGYTPKHWEYYRHPITRFFARYTFPSPQQEYEKYLHELYEQDEKKKIRKLEADVMQKMHERLDYQAYYYVPIDGKYTRLARQQADNQHLTAGTLPPVRDP